MAGRLAHGDGGPVEGDLVLAGAAMPDGGGALAAVTEVTPEGELVVVGRASRLGSGL